MDWNEDIDLTKRKMSSQLIIRRAIARGWQVSSFKTSPAIIFLHIPGRETPAKIFSASPPTMAYPSTKIAKDKYITNALLSEAAIPVPAEMLVGSDFDFGDAKDFLQQHGRLVVKPLDASHGKGITTDVTGAERLERAITDAFEQSARPWVLLQEQIEGFDVRIVCINYQYIDAISREPASVTGDGKHSISELITMTNSSEDRGENYSARLNIIPIDKVESYLGKDAMAAVPQVGEHVQVIGVSNVGTGGVARNLRDDIPLALRQLAEQASVVMELPVCGVDFMVKRIPQAGDTLADLEPKAIEVNECPMLTMYEDTQSEGQTRLIDAYLDYVASTPSINTKKAL